MSQSFSEFNAVTAAQQRPSFQSRRRDLVTCHSPLVTAR